MQNTTFSTGLTIQQPQANDLKALLPSSYVLQLMTIFYNAIVGSAAQVSSGVATHTSIAAAIAAVPTNGSIFIYSGSYTEAITLEKSVSIVGQGSGTQITGNWSIDAVSRVMIQNIYLQGNLTFTNLSSKNFVKNTWIGSSYSVTDNGTDNLWEIIK
jgi:hypothetical protein